ncbi:MULTISPECIES: hypothetical protein [unclassified Sphingomonas]|uniref:hypothetical protein n=1 Tax=unclassified Sphingomonas TaxID=196159 RepID=UPI0006F9AA41|nr:MULTISPECIES: hypothetical protein [unclassified Sphingomonas]KQM58776.1 hypothetical protein ASE65_10455 [Sphingomonas sp. Leaf16]KQN11031.1 hypothetical protein ASE81_11440 [Sphingomonas sp. Leaf29]KQN18333.1 hypothetical protein ASE83_11380 [Sphingomonas sp. Leaf32]
MSSLTAKQAAKLDRLRDDFGYFAKCCLRIRTKEGKVVPFEMNQAQTVLHDRLEEQRKRTGKVRAIILKGRQMGASTYIEARYYWRLWGRKGLTAFILTHEDKATRNLFGMAKRYHENMPPGLAHDTQSANANELSFSGRESAYMVATAGSKETGRSATFQLFHGSEVAFWPNAEDHAAGLGQALSDTDGTEAVFESTAYGIGNVFQRRYAAAQRGDGEYQAIFMPWFWDPGYSKPAPDGWDAGKEWWDYGVQYGLTIEQLYWAYLKNHDMATATGQPTDRPCWKFKQEYPANADEAFQTAGNSFIPSDKVAAARKAKVLGQGPLIIGVDPARGGGDKTGVVSRRGRRIGEVLCDLWDVDDTMVLAGRIVGLIKLHRPDAVNIDVGGLGAGVYDRLRELGYREVYAVNFGSNPIGRGPTGQDLYENRRAEMWDTLRDWFNDPAGVQIPDADAVHGDLTAPVWGSGATRHKSNNELVIEPKDAIRKRLGFSPDLGDAMALTFATPISPALHDDDYEERGRDSVTGY